MSNEQTERDELAEVIRGQLAWSLEAEQGIRTITDAILAAGYRRPRTITTVEELDTLPADSLVLTAAGFAYQCNSDGEVKWWAHPGSGRIFASRKLSLPATVLHEAVAA